MKPMLFAVTALAVVAAPAAAAPVVGRPAPNFKLADANGRPVTLSDFRGKTVVLEWSNPDCPFVKKHYSSGNMQKAQAAAAGDGVVWLTINSSAPGKQGHVNGGQAKSFATHVHRQQGRHPGLRGRYRRQAHAQPGRCHRRA